jgi:hypothetical protein
VSTLEEIRARLKTNDEARYTNLYDARDLLALFDAQSLELQAVREALEIVRPHVDLVQADLNGSYCVAKIDEHTFCGRGRQWPGHRSDAKEWPEHEFVDGSALVAALKQSRGAT